MKLIITDLDNTLLRSDKSISEYTAKVFERIRAKGYLVAFATARGCAMSRFVETIKPDIIVSNGAQQLVLMVRSSTETCCPRKMLRQSLQCAMSSPMARL